MYFELQNNLDNWIVDNLCKVLFLKTDPTHWMQHG